jgi:hypothetical protein
MYSGVACCTERDQVFLGIRSRMTAEFVVVHLEIRHRATELTPKAVTTQNLLAQTFVRRRIKPEENCFRSKHFQAACSRRLSKKICRCSPGKNLK